MRSTLIAGAMALAAIGVGASPAHAQIYRNVGTTGYNSGYSNGGLYSPYSYQSSYYGGSPYLLFGGYRQSTYGGYSPYSYGGYSPYSYGGYRSNYPSQQFYNGGWGFGGRRR